MDAAQPIPLTIIFVGRYRLVTSGGSEYVMIDRSGEGGQFEIKVFEEFMDKLFAEHF